MTVPATCAVIFLLGLSGALRAAEAESWRWPAWRGESSTGSAQGGSYPAEFGPDKNVVWKVELPGRGYSTPAIWDDHIIVTAGIDGENRVLDLDRTGKLRWSASVGKERAGKHRNGSGSNPSATTDGTYVFAYFKSGDLAGLNLAGDVLWSINLQERFAKDTLYWDMGTSPVLAAKHVIASVMHQGDSFLAAFDKLTGKVAWRVARDYTCPPEGDHSYATPIVVQRGGKEILLVWGAERVTAHSTDDGALVWSCAGFNPEQKKNWVVVASAVVAGDIMVVPYGRGSHLAGVALGGEGDVTDTHRRWTRTDAGSFVPTPAFAGGKIYVVGDKGEVLRVSPATGETLTSAQFPKHRTKYYSSPLVADDKLYAAREDGVVMVMAIGDELRVLAQNDLGERVIASPVAVNNRLFIRGEKHLYCFSERL